MEEFWLFSAKLYRIVKDGIRSLWTGEKALMKFNQICAVHLNARHLAAAQLGRIGGLMAALTLIAAGMIFAPTSARAAEHSLAGIRIFASSKEVLTRYGEPTRVLTGADAVGVIQGGSAGVSTPPAAATSQPNTGNRAPEFSAPSAAPAASSTPTDTSDTAGEARFVYDRPNNVELQFLMSPDGRVIEITVLGYKSTVKTTRNISLGSTYGTVITKYGYPEAQDTSTTGILMIRYLEKQHVAFQLHNGKVVGITVAAVE